MYTQTIRRTTQITTNVEECGPCPVFASFILVFALQLRKKHGKTSVSLRKTSISLRKTSVSLRKTSVKLRKTSEYSIHITKTPTHYKTLTNTHKLQNPHIHTRTHTLQNNIKPPQYKLKQNAYRKSNTMG
jgi:hypothetical protein